MLILLLVYKLLSATVIYKHDQILSIPMLKWFLVAKSPVKVGRIMQL